MISKKMKYALKALIYIAKQKEGQVRTKEIADNAGIPKKFLEQILLQLKRGHVVNSKQGNTGGYYLMKDPENVTLADVYRLIDGPIALISCASKNFYEPCEDCINEANCRIRESLVDVRDQMLEVMERTTIGQLIK